MSHNWSKAKPIVMNSKATKPGTGPVTRAAPGSSSSSSIEHQLATVVARLDTLATTDQMTAALAGHKEEILSRVDGVAKQLSTFQEETETRLTAQDTRMDGFAAQITALEHQQGTQQAQMDVLSKYMQYREHGRQCRISAEEGCTELEESADERSATGLERVAVTTSVVTAVLEKLLVPGLNDLFKVGAGERVGQVAGGRPRAITFELGSPKQLQLLMRHVNSPAIKPLLVALKIMVSEYLTPDEALLRDLVQSDADWAQAREAAKAAGNRAGLRRAVPYVGNEVWDGASGMLQRICSDPRWRDVARARKGRMGRGGGAGAGGVA